MNHLDPYTLAFITSLIGLYLAVNMVGIRMAGTRHRAVLLWAGSGVLLAVGYQLSRFVMSPEVGPLDPQTAVALANFFIVGSHGLLLLGFQDYFNRRPWFLWVALLVFFLLVAGLFWSPMQASAALRVTVLTVTEGVIFGASIHLLWQSPRAHLTRYSRALAVVIFAQLGLLVARCAMLWIDHFKGGGDGSAALLTPLIFSSMVFYMLLSLMLALLLFRQKEAQLQSLALLDPLTGLRNRRLLHRAMEQQTRRTQSEGEPFCVLVLDLDHFKQINDQHGHAAGDEVLIASADRLKTLVRRKDALFRTGGEEFLLLMPNTSRAAGLDLAERIRAVFSQGAVIGALADYPVTVSIGLAAAGPGEELDAATILKRADQLMYKAKKLGRNRVESDDSPRSDDGRAEPLPGSMP